MAKVNGQGQMEAQRDENDFLDFIDDAVVPGFEKPKTTTPTILSVAREGDQVLDSSDESYIKGAKPGDFIVKSSRMVVTSPTHVVPLEYRHLYSEFKPNMGEFVGYCTPEVALDKAIDPYKFGSLESKEGNKLNESHVFILSLLEHDNMVVILPMMSSKIPDALNWYRNMMSTNYNGRKVAPWNQVWTLSTKLSRNSRGSWFLIKADFASIVDRNIYDAIASVRETMRPVKDLLLEADY